MPGIISGVFTPEDESAQTQETAAGADGETGLDLSPSLTVELSGDYEDLDGSTHSWSNTTEVGLDVGATLGYAAGLGVAETDISDPAS